MRGSEEEVLLFFANSKADIGFRRESFDTGSGEPIPITLYALLLSASR